MVVKPNEGLYHDPTLAQFYDSASENRVDFEFCLNLAVAGQAVLDLGCGTGELAVKLAEQCSDFPINVTGVEPAAAMLDIARERLGGEKVKWVEADARTVRLGEKFDLIILTGHSFQVFLTESDQLELLYSIATHLKPEGRFIFDSRNPNYKAPKTRESENNIRILQHAEHGEIEMWNESVYDDELDILSYRNGFRILATNEDFVSSAQIKYTPYDELLRLIDKAGLTVERCYGDWHRSLYSEEARDIIPFGGLK